jgi:nucleoside-diphosphate-sugar epimerase
MVYGNFEGKNVKESDQLNPLGIYAALKLSGEIIVKSYNQVFDLPYTIIRPSALYGERCVSRRVSQIFIENALSNKPIIINGDGEEKLDFTYINDLILGIKLCIENKKSINQTFNITYGNGRKINELIRILGKYYPSLVINFKKRDKLMPERGTLDISKAKELLNFNPEFPLEKGFTKYIEWYSDFFENKIK